MEMLKKNVVLLLVLGALTLFLTAGTVWASTAGWGVENAKPPDQRQRASTRHGHGYMIWYGVGSRRGGGPGGYGGGGGFRGGK
jgi:hypothetical protein